MVTIQRILLPTNFTELARSAAGYARALAVTYGAQLHVVHVVPSIAQAVPAPEVGNIALVPPGPETIEPARQALAAFVRELLADAAVPITTAVLLGTPDLALTRYASEQHIDLIVVGTHARGIMRRLLLGSVSKAVLEHAPCPVLMVPLAPATHDPPPDRRS